MTECAYAEDWRPLAQFLVLCFASAALVCKWLFEHPRREFDVWCLDVSKQAIGYALSLVIEAIFLRNMSRDYIDGDECEGYFMTYLYDSVFGFIFNIAGVYCLQVLLCKYFPTHRVKEFVKFGYYGEPFSWDIYLVQLCLWVLIVINGKLLIIIFFLVTTPSLGPIFRVIFSMFPNESQLKLLLIAFVMPVLLTSVAVWLQDVFLKYDRVEEESQIYLVRCLSPYHLCFISLSFVILSVFHIALCTSKLFCS